MPSAPSFHLYLPQLRLSFDALVDRARRAEAAGFEGVALMDHLAPPRATEQPMYEALITATWLAAHTAQLRLGHLVLCDSFRHPAVLAKQAVSIDHASGGRFELGIGSGSTPDELSVFGIGRRAKRERTARLAETLAVLRALWSGEEVEIDGEHHRLEGARQRPVPAGRIPVTIGGTSPAILALVREHGDWWNIPTRELGRLDELRPEAAGAGVSILVMLALVHDEAEREATTATALRRFGDMAGGGLLIGDARELTERLRELHERGVGRFYVWFTDFAPPRTLAAFGRVIEACAGH